MKIAILMPTYNRSRILSENLSRILRFSSPENVVIYVSENCGTDDTQSVMQEFVGTHSNVFYKRNDRNLGFDANVASLIRWAKEDYIWLMGDDDYVCEGAIDKLLQILRLQEVDAVVVNGAERSPGMEPKSSLQTRVYEDPNEVAQDLCLHASWMSSIIIKRELLDDFPAEKLDGSLFIHLQALFHALARKGEFRLFCSNDVFVTYPAEKDIVNSWAAHTLYCFLDRWSFNIDALPGDISAETREICFRKSFIRGRTFIRLRAIGAYRASDFRKYVKFIRRKGLLVPAAAALLMPRWMCRLLIWANTRHAQPEVATP